MKPTVIRELQISKTGCWCYTESVQPNIMHASDVNINQTEIRNKRIAIIGGGMTALNLALSACEKGAKKAVVIARHKLKTQEQSCDPGWTGNKFLGPFKSNSSWQVCFIC